MLHEPLIRELKALRLNGMAAALAHQGSEVRDLDFDERLGLLIQHELTERASARLAQRLRWAKLPQSAALEDLDTRTPRGLDPRQLAQVRDLAWIDEHLNVLVTGPAAWAKLPRLRARARRLSRRPQRALLRLPRLADELARYRA